MLQKQLDSLCSAGGCDFDSHVLDFMLPIIRCNMCISNAAKLLYKSFLWAFRYFVGVDHWTPFEYPHKRNRILQIWRSRGPWYVAISGDDVVWKQTLTASKPCYWLPYPVEIKCLAWFQISLLLEETKIRKLFGYHVWCDGIRITIIVLKELGMKSSCTGSVSNSKCSLQFVWQILS